MSSFLLFALALIANTLFISSTKADGAVSDRIRFQSLTLEDGLSQSTVYDITEDRLGFMWFGTQDGLNRYDGVRFDQLRHESHDSTTISSPTINQLLYDQQNAVWVLTPQGLDSVDIISLGITHWTQELKDVAVDTDSGDDTFQIHAVALAPDNKVVALTDHYLALISQDTASVTRLTQFDNILEDHKVSKFVLREDRVYLLEGSCIISVDMTGRDKNTECLSSQLELLELFVNPEDNDQILVTAEEGFALFDTETEEQVASFRYFPVMDGRSQNLARIRQLLPYKNGY
ncbi:hypothetical protein GCM10023151_02380 [Kangiella marina]|uniref:Hybrid sensor histidine kinase/response regulator n=2 Tax=Kangiella marina TaxID=1079178 RepID=A0ABP8IBL7_9GAMM